MCDSPNKLENIFNDIINECLKYDIITVQKGGGSTVGSGSTVGGVINKLIFSELLFNQFGGKSVKKWTTFSHNGVLFPEPYQAHGIPLVYGDKKEKIYLDPESEEYATIYSKFVDTEYVKNKLFKQLKIYFISKKLNISSNCQCSFNSNIVI